MRSFEIYVQSRGGELRMRRVFDVEIQQASKMYYAMKRRCKFFQHGYIDELLDGKYTTVMHDNGGLLKRQKGPRR